MRYRSEPLSSDGPGQGRGNGSKSVSRLVSVFFSLCFAAGAGVLLAGAVPEDLRMGLFGILFLAAYGLRYAADALAARYGKGLPDRRFLLAGYVWAFLFFTAAAAGRAMYLTNSLTALFRGSPAGPVTFALFWIGGAGVFGRPAAYLMRAFASPRRAAGPAGTRFPFLRFALCAALLLALWAPVFLAYYPGVYSYDCGQQMSEFITGTVSRFQSALHTALWGLCFHAARAAGREPVTVYVLCQMLFCALAGAYAVTSLGCLGAPRRVRIALLAFWGLFPLSALFSVTFVKDTPFTACFLVAVVESLWLAWDRPRPAHAVLYALSALLACLFRNNAVYAIVPAAIPAAVRLLRSRRVLFAAALFAPAVLYLLVNGPLYDRLGVLPGDPREALSVPVQQIARAAASNDLTPEESAALDAYFGGADVAAAYNPRFADPVKSSFNTALFRSPGGKRGFFALWVSLLRARPGEYLDAALTLDLPLWYPFADLTDPFSGRIYAETSAEYDEDDTYTPQRRSKLPGLLSVYERIADASALRGVPVVRRLFSISLPVWAHLFALLALAAGRRRGAAVPLYALLLWATYLAGPVANLRYVFPLIQLYPVLFAVPYLSGDAEAASPVPGGTPHA